jgi:hypothetical protein
MHRKIVADKQFGKYLSYWCPVVIHTIFYNITHYKYKYKKYHGQKWVKM